MGLAGQPIQPNWPVRNWDAAQQPRALAYYSCKGSTFSSQHPCWVLHQQLPETSSLGRTTPFQASSDAYTQAHTLTQMHVCTHNSKRLKTTTNKPKPWNWRGGSQLKALTALANGPKVSSQYLYGVSQPSLTPGDLMPSTGCHGHCMHIAYRHTCHKTLIHIKKKNHPGLVAHAFSPSTQDLCEFKVILI